MKGHSYPTGDYRGVGGKVEERQKLFDEKTRDACWRKAALLLGRDPERWRQDAAGNAVTRALWGIEGLHGYMYDHIVPVSKGGKSTLDNCQILQAMVYLAKPEEGWVDPAKEMWNNSPSLKCNDKDLDDIDAGIYGNVSRSNSSSGQ